MKSKNILIIEDKEQERKLFEYLVGQIHSFQSFDKWNKALDHLANQKPNLILISLQLTDLEPLLFLQKVRALANSSCLVVALSSTTDPTQAAFYKGKGFDDMISKPIRPKEFILKIQSLLARQAESEEKTLEKTDLVPILNLDFYQQLLRLSSKEVILQVFSDFAEECENLLQLLERSQAIETTEEITRAIHTLKGNSGTLGAEKVYVAAKQCESLGRLQKTIEFTESLHYLKASIKEFQEFLRIEHSLNNV
jgi:two-component system alkaline phosphatase synthesis response regulator PhoP